MGASGLNSPCQGITGNHTGQHIPSNQPTSYLSRPLSRYLDSLPPHHLNPYYNSSLHHRNWLAYAFLHRLDGGDHVVWQQECVEGGNGVSPVLGSQWIRLANNIPWVFSDGCHTLGQGRLHLGSDDRSRLG